MNHIVSSPSVRIPRGAGITVLVGICSLPALSLAGGPPVPFDGFTVEEGIITADCPIIGGVAAVCSNELVDNGMLQREVFIASGPRAGNYIQFIITEPGVSGDASADPFSADRGSLNFVHEDFIRMYNRGDGISSRQTMIESDFASATLENRFVSTMEYEFGWANSIAFPWVRMHQDISEIDYSLDPGNPAERFRSTAAITSDGIGFNNHLDVELSQRVDLGDGVQQFRYEKVAGFYQLTTRTGDGTLLPGGSNGGDIDWGLGEMLSAVWIGQILDGAEFSHTGFRNEDQATSAALTSLTSAQAVNWVVPPFSTLPPLSVNVTVAPTAAVAPPVPLQATIPSSLPSADPTVPVALPVAYDAWTVAGGVVTPAACPEEVDCGPAIVNGDGLFQRILVVDGDTYVHTIVTDPGATGDPNAGDFEANSLAFKSETFVRQGVDGLAAKMRIAERDLAYVTQPAIGSLPSSGGDFVYQVEQKVGWAHGGPLDPTIDIHQRITVPDQNYLHTSSVGNVFHLMQGTTPADRAMHMSSVVGTNAGGGSGFLDPIMFHTSMVQGQFQTTTRILDPFDPLLPGNGGDIAWNPGDAIQATWIGGDYVTTDPAGRTTIGTTSYYNLSTGDHVTGTSLEDPDPASWVDPFEPPGVTYTNLYIP